MLERQSYYSPVLDRKIVNADGVMASRTLANMITWKIFVVRIIHIKEYGVVFHLGIINTMQILFT